MIIIIPIACLMRMHAHDQFEIQIMQTHHSRNSIILPPLITSIIVMMIFWYREMDLNRKTAVILVIIYLLYLAFNISVFWSDED